jgi:hypothetical protein
MQDTTNVTQSPTTQAVETSNPTNLTNLPPDEHEFVSTCLDIMRRNCGSLTPCEEFVHDVVATYKHRHGALTPDDVEMALTEFQQNFDDALRVARDMTERFGESLAMTASTPQ